jgi:bacterioferritin-associated ferredoxin
MIICHCVGASDRTIHEAIRAGATTVADIARCTGAGRCCEACREEIDALLLAAAHGADERFSGRRVGEDLVAPRTDEGAVAGNQDASTPELGPPL